FRFPCCRHCFRTDQLPCPDTRADDQARPTWRSPMPTVSAGDASVHYEVAGSGPGLVLVHGTQGNGETNWRHLVGRFADARTVITPDYSGSGRTTDGGGELTPESLAEQVGAVAREAADGPVDLLGFSLGAVVAAATAALHPELVRRLVLVAGWAHGE